VRSWPGALIKLDLGYALFALIVAGVFRIVMLRYSALVGLDTLRIYLNSLTMSLAVLSQSALTTTVFLSTSKSNHSTDVLISRSHTLSKGFVDLVDRDAL